MMYKNRNVLNFLNLKLMSLQKFHYSGFACRKEEAFEVIQKLIDEPVAILGGDVYEFKNNSPHPLADNWFCEKKDIENWEEYCARSKQKALDYIKTYPENEHDLFSFIFSDELSAALDLQVNDKEADKFAIYLDGAWLMCPDCIDAWESSSTDPIVICPKCNQALHIPIINHERYK